MKTVRQSLLFLLVAALGTALVMPGSLGSDEYARHDGNCLMPEAGVEAIVAAALALREQGLRERLCSQAARTAMSFDLPAERAAFGEVLRELSA